MMHFELVGLAGAGKTTLLDHCTEVRSARDLIHHEGRRQPHRRLPRLVARAAPGPLRRRMMRAIAPRLDHVSGFVAAEAGFAALVFDVVAAIPEPRLRFEATRGMLNVWAQIALARELAAYSEPIVFDEGLCQRALSLAVRSPDIDWLPRYVDALPPVAGVVIVDASYDVTIQRQRDRGRSSPDPVARRGRAALDVLVPLLEARGTPPLWAVSTEGSLSAAAEALTTFIGAVASPPHVKQEPVTLGD